MAGSLFGLGLSQQFGPDGRVASGALLYIYEANTSTPAVTYADFSLASEQAWPLEADSVVFLRFGLMTARTEQD
jgi:hypothetical protein